MRISLIPLFTASSTTYCRVGVSTIGNISLGMAFVTGKNLVPNPAAGITAFLILLIYTPEWLTVMECNIHIYYMYIFHYIP